MSVTLVCIFLLVVFLCACWHMSIAIEQDNPIDVISGSIVMLMAGAEFLFIFFSEFK